MIGECGVQLVAKNNHFGLLSQGESTWMEHEFDIVVYDNDGVEAVAGHMSVHKLNIGDAMRQKLSLDMVFDDFSQGASDCYMAIFDNEGYIRKRFQDEYYGQMEDLFNDFHLLNRVEIDEAFKGKGLVGIATQIYLENFANGSDVAYFKAFPLQYEGNDKPYKRRFTGDLKSCEKKLCTYYQSLGFRRIGKTPHFFFVVDDFLDKRKDMQ